MAFKCPVPGCEDSEKEFQTETARKSHIRNKPPEFTECMVREDPIVEEGFHRLVVSYRHNKGGQLRCLRQASFETVEG